MKKKLILVLCVLLTGCRTTYEFDTEEKYRKFLTYSLGNYQIYTQDTVEKYNGLLPSFDKYTVWGLKYKDTKKYYVLEIDNHSANENRDRNLTSDIITHIVTRLEDEVMDALMEEFPTEDDLSISIKLSSPKNVRRFINKKKGIKLNELQYDDVKKYGMHYSLDIYNQVSTVEDVEVYQAKVNKIVSKLENVIGEVDLEVSVRILDRDNDFKLRGTGDGDGFDWSLED